eukprot:TRINITY_DN14955_c0_g1_i1.p1 TRINITY_DN14955_c0_g1~~TRINITY_DN14955_c0_g1_i1.p1  ORF type:complete len:492 (-),score=137.91 TRINITY_DN14955_c0_g1_i1:151-1626(-)
MPVFDFTNNNVGGAAMIIWILWTPFFLGTIVLFVLRRNLYPIKQREPLLLGLSAVGGYLLFTEFSWEAFWTPALWPCPLPHWTIWFTYPYYFIPYLLRAVRLLFIFRLNWANINMGLLADDKAELPRSTRFLVRYRKQLLRVGFLLFPLSAIALLVGLIRQFEIETNLPGNFGCGNTRVFFLLTMVLLTVFLIFLVAVIWLLRTVKDEFNINRELQVVAGSWILFIYPFIIANLVAKYGPNGHDDTSPSFPTVFLIQIVIMITYLASVAWPLWRSLFEQKQVQWLGVDVVANLDSTLSNETSLDYFKRFLVQEFSVENLLFWLDVKQMKDISDRNELISRAITIYDKYFGDDAVTELNVDSTLLPPIDSAVFKLKSKLNSEPIKKKKSRVTLKLVKGESASEVELTSDETDDIRTIYDPPQQSCYLLMQDSSFPRFKRNALCKQLVEKLKREEAIEKIVEEGVFPSSSSLTVSPETSPVKSKPIINGSLDD